MARVSAFWWVVGLCVLLVIASRAFYTVSETEQVVVTQLGRPVRLVKTPGLHLKVPFLQQLTFFEDRLLDYDAAPAPVITRDKKNLLVDNYAKWQISDPLKFLQTVQDEAGAQARLDDIIYSKVREQLGLHDLVEVIASKRDPIMRAVTAGSHEASIAYGIAVIDVRIKRADLPPENAQAVYGRMRTEREREAKRYRSEGQEPKPISRRRSCWPRPMNTSRRFAAREMRRRCASMPRRSSMTRTFLPLPAHLRLTGNR